MTESAREFHERTPNQEWALTLLRRGPVTKREFERQAKDGSRLAPTIDILRNAHGFCIDGDGSIRSPYRMLMSRQLPTRVKTQDKFKEAYYASAHWRSVRDRRLDRDSWRCVLCGAEDDLEVHHFRYRLFAERMEDVVTFCSEHHIMVHEHSRISFPKGMTVDEVTRLGFEPEFESWLLPADPVKPLPIRSDSRGQLELFP